MLKQSNTHYKEIIKNRYYYNVILLLYRTMRISALQRYCGINDIENVPTDNIIV